MTINCVAGLYADAVFVFYFFHDEGALKGGNVLVVAYDVEQKLLVILHVGSLDAQQVVEAAGYIIAFGYFGNVAHHCGEGYGSLAVKATELDAAEDGEAFIELLGVKDGGVLAYEA